MGLFGKSKENDEKKILEEMKKKKEQIDKLKEEMNNMAKLVLKDGKLQKVEEKKDEVLPIIPPNPPSTKSIEYDNPELAMNEAQQAMREDYRRKMQEQMLREQMVQNEQLRQQQYNEQLRQQQLRQQQYVQPESPVIIKVIIEMISGVSYGLEIPENQITAFLTDLDTAINNQTTFPLNNRVINGRNIVSYVIE